MRIIRYTLLSLLALTPFVAFAVTGEDTRFDWSLGTPTIVDDSTSTCNDTAVARFDWSLGQPTIVHDATANCTAAAAGVASSDALIIDRGELILQGELLLPD